MLSTPSPHFSFTHSVDFSVHSSFILMISIYFSRFYRLYWIEKVDCLTLFFFLPLFEQVLCEVFQLSHLDFDGVSLFFVLLFSHHHHHVHHSRYIRRFSSFVCASNTNNSISFFVSLAYWTVFLFTMRSSLWNDH